jgi:hypothetical protein
MHDEMNEFAALHRGRIERPRTMSRMKTPRLCCVPGCVELEREDARSRGEHFVCTRHRERGPVEIRVLR